MKILHINKSHEKGGAAKIARRLHKGFLDLGIDSSMLVDESLNGEEKIYGLTTFLDEAKHRLRKKLDNLPLRRYSSGVNTFDPGFWGRILVNHPLIKQADILHFHWINAGFISIKQIKKLNELGKPIVWTLHDMWPITGGCHHARNCDKFKTHCGTCPQLFSSKEKDLSYYFFKRKLEAYSSNIHPVAISNWMKDSIKQSKLFKNQHVSLIHNGLDINVFSPVNKAFAKQLLNIPKEKKIISFGAMNATSDPKKGFTYLIKALELVNNKYGDDVFLLVFGNNAPSLVDVKGSNIKFMGTIRDDYSMSLLYNASDVFVGPSLVESFGLTHLESMSCGTPVVAFNSSGPKELIDHKKNGYLADYRDTQDLAEGIKWCIEDKERNHKLGLSAREKVEQLYSLESCLDKYLSLYQSLLHGTKSPVKEPIDVE